MWAAVLLKVRPFDAGTKVPRSQDTPNLGGNRERMTFAGLFLRMVGDGGQTGGG